MLGPLMVPGVLALGLLDWDSGPLHHPARYAVGGVLFACGGAFALWGYFGLGFRASQGVNEGLVASGAYRHSRNPPYVGTIAALLGYALVSNATLVLVCWAVWTLWFLAAPFAEEPWLRRQLGASYDAYAARVPRFLPRTRTTRP